jgi:DNA-binding NtrC family response regulator
MQQNSDITKRVVYFADHNEKFVKTFLHYMSDSGIDIRTFTCSSDLMENLSVSPALLIINGYFDNGRGFEMAESLRERFRGLTIVMILDTDSFDLQMRALKIAPLCSLIMPVDFCDLKEIIFKAVGV